MNVIRVGFALVLLVCAAGCDVTGSHGRCQAMLESDEPRPVGGNVALLKNPSDRPPAAAVAVPADVAGEYGLEGKANKVTFAYRLTLTADRHATFLFIMTSPGIAFEPIVKQGKYEINGDRVVCSFKVNAVDMMKNLGVRPGMDLRAAMEFSETSQQFIPCTDDGPLTVRWNDAKKGLDLRSYTLLRIR